MIRELCKDTLFLARKAEIATANVLGVAQDLLDTLIAHRDGCVGMAANMIGVNKRIIAFDNEGSYMVMFNPVIVKRSEAYEPEEGCLCLAVLLLSGGLRAQFGSYGPQDCDGVPVIFSFHR